MENFTIDLSGHRSVIQITGNDAATFLQGLITNDIHSASDDKAIYACLLTPQGKFLYEMFIIGHDGGYLLDVQSNTAEALMKRLKMYKLRSDVTLEMTNYKVIASNSNLSALTSFTDPRHSDMGSRFICQDTPELAFNDFEIYDMHRLTLGIPDGDRDMIADKSIMLESGIDDLNGIHWDKGCYVGQELTARTKHRGLVRKRLLPVTFEGAAPEFGSLLYKDGKKAGEMRSHYQNQGLALIRLEHLQDNSAVETEDGKKLEVSIPSWVELPLDPVSK